MKFMLSLALAGVASLGVAHADLSLTSSVLGNGTLYTYDYVYSLTGAGSVDNLYLGSDDLSPISGVTYKKNSLATTAWDFLGNDTPSNYLQFFSATDSLSNGDKLEVIFSSPASLFVPQGGHFASGYDSAAGNAFFVTGSVIAPTAVPEPGALSLLLGAGIAGMGLLVRRRK